MSVSNRRDGTSLSGSLEFRLSNAQRALVIQPKGGREAASLGFRSAQRHEPGTGSVIRASLADTHPSSPLATGPRWGPIHGGDVYPKEAAFASTLGLHDGGPSDHEHGVLSGDGHR